MASSNLLKEAIADAKAVRETAIANAKLALEEAFTPRLQSMLSNKIEEELDEQSDSSGIGAGDNKVNLASGDDEEKNAETKKISKAYGSEDPNLKVVDKLTEADEDEKDEMKDDEKDEMMKKEADMDMDKEDDGDVTINIDADGDEDDDDMDMELEAIIKELEEDEDEKSEMEDEKDEMMKEMEKSEMEDEKKEMEDEKDEMMKEMAKEKSEMEKEKSEEDEKDEMMKEEEDLNIESILAALKEEDEENEEEEKDEMYKEQLEEAYDTIRSLKATLNEVNLLNAKLLFSNKLFKSQNLTESQKMRVIETFDRAHSLREVKLVYTTLAESLKTPVSKTKKLRTEGLASKAQTTTKPKQVISEGNEMASRMKKLAGLL
tara:strand:- start:438 stop:1565 length:1128 start_codon:yes stop_codon:yes gene_type:complete